MGVILTTYIHLDDPPSAGCFHKFQWRDVCWCFRKKEKKQIQLMIGECLRLSICLYKASHISSWLQDCFLWTVCVALTMVIKTTYPTKSWVPIRSSSKYPQQPSPKPHKATCRFQPVDVHKSSSWRFQPIWKICSSNWIISPGFGMNIKNLWVATT